MPRGNYTPEIVVANTNDISEDEWLEYRRNGLGGSDIAIMKGLSTFKTARDLYLDKLRIEPMEVDDEEEKWCLEIGHALEPVVAKMFASNHPDIFVEELPIMFRHPDYPWMIADIDRLLHLPDGRTGILECKSSSHLLRDKWDNDSCPYNYELQVRHYMAVMNLDFVWVGCLFDNWGTNYVERYIERDYDLEDELIAEEMHFWKENIEKRIPPLYTESGDLVIESVRRQYGRKTSSVPMKLEPADAATLDRVLQLRDKKSKLDRKSREYDNKIKQAYGSILDKMGHYAAAYCKTKNGSYSVFYDERTKLKINTAGQEKLKKDHPDIFKEYAVETETRQFKVNYKEAT